MATAGFDVVINYAANQAAAAETAKLCTERAAVAGHLNVGQPGSPIRGQLAPEAVLWGRHDVRGVAGLRQGADKRPSDDAMAALYKGHIGGHDGDAHETSPVAEKRHAGIKVMPKLNTSGFSTNLRIPVKHCHLTI